MPIEVAGVGAALMAKRLCSCIHRVEIVLDSVGGRAHELVRTAAPTSVAEHGGGAGLAQLPGCEAKSRDLPSVDPTALSVDLGKSAFCTDVTGVVVVARVRVVSESRRALELRALLHLIGPGDKRPQRARAHAAVGMLLEVPRLGD